MVFAGTPAAAVPSLRAIIAAGHEVMAVATNPDAPVGRGRRPAPSPVAALAAEHGIETLKPRRARDPEFAARLADLAPEACLIVAWGQLIPDALLALPRYGWINLHFSLLPAWRGAAPVQRALMAGAATTGVTTFRLVHDLDAGPVFRHVSTLIGPDETAGELLERLAGIGADVLVETLADLARGAEPVAQPDGPVTLAPKVTAEDARIDWCRDAMAIHNLVRGTSPAPGAWTTLDGTRFGVERTRPAGLDGPPDGLVPGELAPTKRALLVGTAAGVLELVSVRAAGRPGMAGADWARGARPAPGARLV